MYRAVLAAMRYKVALPIVLGTYGSMTEGAIAGPVPPGFALTVVGHFPVLWQWFAWHLTPQQSAGPDAARW